MKTRKEENKALSKGIIAMGIFITFFCSSLSFAEDHGQRIDHGSIKASHAESEFPAMARIQFKQAIDIALARIHGDLLKVELEDEDGYLVFNTEVVTPDKKIKEIKIDAGNGEILQVEDDDLDENDRVEK